MYNFDELSNRKNTYSIKYDCKDNELPMWVADMDFKVAPAILKAIKKRASIDSFGYQYIPDSYFKSYINWWKRRHDLSIKREWMLYSTGVVPSISSIVRRITNPGEKVIIFSPVYNIFYNSIINNGRFVNSSDLVYDNKGNFELDFNDLEEKMKDPLSTLLILCNPHNPVGKIWSNSELERIKELSNIYNVKVISDEIHCDIVEKGYSYTPYLKVKGSNKNAIMLISATKCFSIPGLASSALVIEDNDLRFTINRGLNNDEVAEGNSFSIDPIIQAFNKEEAWVNEMNEYVENNKKHFISEIESNTELICTKGHATYLLFVDIKAYDLDAVSFCNKLRSTTGLWVTPGIEYGINAKHFFRINLATSKENVDKAIKYLISFTKNYKKEDTL